MKRLDDVTMILVETALVAVIVAALFGVAVLHAQVLVHMDRADYTHGVQAVECIADAGQSIRYAGNLLLVSCHSEPDGIFRNSFEVTS